MYEAGLPFIEWKTLAWQAAYGGRKRSWRFVGQHSLHVVRTPGNPGTPPEYFRTPQQTQKSRREVFLSVESLTGRKQRT